MQMTNLRDQMGVNTTDFTAIMENAVNAINESETVGTVRDTSAIRNAAQEMESFFINQMFQAMRRTIPEPEGMFERSHAEVIFQEMLDQEVAINLSRNGGIGLADKIYADMTRNLS